MCGIFGTVINSNAGFMQADVEFFNTAMITDSIRGVDSTGVFSVDKTGNFDWVKIASHPFSLLQKKDYKEWVKKSIKDCKIMVGHNRKATMGAIVNENAHPFTVGHICLVHNGFISNSAEIDPDHKSNEFPDSHAVAWALSKAENPVSVLERLEGAYTLVWYNALQKKMYMCRNSGRPLFTHVSTGGYKLLFASEGMMLEWLMRRDNTAVEKIVELPTYCLMSIDVSKNGFEVELEKYEPKKWVAKNATYPILTEEEAYAAWSDCMGPSFEGCAVNEEEEKELPAGPEDDLELLVYKKRNHVNLTPALLKPPKEQNQNMHISNIGNYYADIGDTVFFAPVTYHEGALPSTFVLTGTTRNPQWGRKIYHVEYHLDDDRKEEWLKKILKNFGGCVGRLLRYKDQGDTMVVDRVRPYKVCQTADGYILPEMMFNVIRATNSCIKCKNKLDKKKDTPDMCKLSYSTSDKWSITCAECHTLPDAADNNGKGTAVIRTPAWEYAKYNGGS